MIEIIPNYHPLFVHFPIAYATAALFFFAAGILFGKKSWAAQCLIFARWMLWAATIFAGIAAVFGWFAYNSVDHDEAGHQAMTLHRNWALATLGVLTLLAAIDGWLRRFVIAVPYGFLALLLVAWLLVISTAWHGSEVVYRHGLGVMSLPKAEGPGHPDERRPAQNEAASHGDGHDHNATVTEAPHKKTGHTHAPGTAPHND